MTNIFQEKDSYDKITDVYFTSDLHLYHDREFIWKARGFNSVEEMNEAIERNWNHVIKKDCHVYVLGDLMLGGASNKGIEILNRLNGHIHIITGNHDTDYRLKLYKEVPSVDSVSYAGMVKYLGYKFFLTHYPCNTGNLEKESLTQMTLNLFGHTHSKDKFYMDLPYMYNVAVDAHNCTPVHIEDIIHDMKAKVEECKEQL